MIDLIFALVVAVMGAAKLDNGETKNERFFIFFSVLLDFKIIPE